MQRRQFIKSAAVGLTTLATTKPARAGASDTLRFGIAGLSRGRAIAQALVQGRLNTDIVALCDVDPTRITALQKNLAEHQHATPTAYTDYRKMLDDKSIDAIAVATPDHWHVPLSIFSILAGKDVYVEKPISHTVEEGRRLVQFARKHDKVVQHGTQSRSGQYVIDAINYLRSGKLGKIRMAKAINSQLRGPIGRRADCDPPAGIDYDIWLGPAPKRPFNPNRWHYNWHWHWDYGTGDIGNDGVHQIDVARWGLGVTLPRAVSCSAGQLFYDDDHQTPDTQVATFEYDDSYLLFEMRLWTPYKLEGHDNGNIFYGDNGMLSLGRDGWEVTFKDGGKGPSGRTTDRVKTHVRNFVEAVRSRKPQDLNAECEEGHYSAALAHLGNIAGRVGKRIEFDAKSETITNDKVANALLAKAYRKGYALPAVT